MGAAKIEDVFFEGELLVVRVVPIRRGGPRCGLCRRVCPGYDGPRGRRRRRALDLGSVRTLVEAEVARVSCPEHGVVIERVPWAVHGSGFTKAFGDQVGRLVVECSKTAVATLMRIAWRTVGRGSWSRSPNACSDLGSNWPACAGSGSTRSAVVDHESGRLVWAAEGRDELTLSHFFRTLGSHRCARITHLSADGAWWIKNVVEFFCPQAVLGLDPFHAVASATKALYEVRREVWNEARHAGAHVHARQIKRTRWALWKDADHLTDPQRGADSDGIRAPLEGGLRVGPA